MDNTKATLVKEANALVLVNRDLSVIEQFFTEDYQVNVGTRTGTGYDFIRKALQLTQNAFPSLEVAVEILVEDGSRVAWVRTMTGVQEGAYKGFPATHRRVVWREMVTSEFREGRIAREWLLSDLAEHLLLARKR